MRIYTSYFANIKVLRSNGIVPIGISRIPPDWFDGINITAVAPSFDLLRRIHNNTINKEQYVTEYKEEMLSVDIDGFIDSIKCIANGKDVALCCYEKPSDFCHRHILANILNDRFNCKIEEYIEKTSTSLF